MPSLVVEKLKGKPPAENPGYQPYGACRELMRCRAPVVLLEGPAGTGKSRAWLEKLHLQAIKYAGMRGAIIRKTRESLTHSAMETYEREVMTPPESIPFNHEDQEYRYPNGSKIIVGGMDKASKVMSSQYDTIYVQEATELVEDEGAILTTRLRNGVIPYQQLGMDCNPSGPDHWLNQWCIQGRSVRLESKHEDNPRVTPEYLAQLDRLTGYLYRRLRLGEWCGAEGMFFAEWDERLHICEPFEVPDYWTKWASIDYGYSDPFACLWYARDPEDQYHIYVYREAYSTGLRDEQQAQAIRRADKGERIAWYVADPSVFNTRREQQKPSIAIVYFKNGLRPLTAGVNNRTMGWQTVRRALAVNEERKPRLQVMKGRAPNLVRTLPAMVHDPLDTEDLADKIRSVKTEDHACFRAGTPISTEFGPIPIEYVKVGTRVWTRVGWRTVTDSAMTDLAAWVYAVRLSNGKNLFATTSHPIWVEGKGFVPVHALRYGDILSSEVNTWQQIPSSSTASGSVVTQSLPIRPRPTTTPRVVMIVKRGLGSFIKRCGERLMGESQTAAKSTIETETPSTTIPPISSPSQWSSIAINTNQWNPLLDPSSTSRLFGPWPRSGTDLKQGESGTDSMVKTPGLEESSRGSYVKSADLALSVSSTGATDSVPTSARVLGVVSLGLTMLSGLVLFAARSFGPTSIPTSRPVPASVVSVLGVNYAGRAPVYNLTVEDAHEYYAQGILVSNCDSLRYGLVLESMPAAQKAKTHSFRFEA